MVKKSPPTPDINEKAPRPRHLSSDSDDIPTMDSSPPATSRTDKEIDQAEGVDPEAYKEFWAERQSFPQQDDPDQEGLWDEEEPDDLTIKHLVPGPDEADDVEGIPDTGRNEETVDRNDAAEKTGSHKSSDV